MVNRIVLFGVPVHLALAFAGARDALYAAVAVWGWACAVCAVRALREDLHI